MKAASKPKVASVSRKKTGPEMPIILQDVPPGYDWGWYSREEARMHLQVIDEKHKELKYKVWLEERGRRVFQSVGNIPSKVLKALRAEIVAYRQFIEDRWVRFMIEKGWIEAHFSAPQVTLNVYPNTPNRFTRTLDLAAEFPGVPKEMSQLKPSDVGLSKKKASVEIYPHLPDPDRMDVRLSDIIWEG